jgi:hypothetical protein
MIFNISPYIGVEEIEFDMQRQKVRNKFNGDYREFKKTKFSINTTDAFQFCHVYYDNANLCEAIEFFEPAIVAFDNFQITGKSYRVVKEYFENIDEKLDFNDAGFTSYKYGVGVFAPYALDEPDGLIEAIIIFRNGYYDVNV